MSTLHEELLARIDELGQHLTGCVSCTTCEASALTGLARAVVELHKPEPTHPGPLSTLVCHGCELDGYDAEHPPWPCWTITAIAEALGIGETPK